jgi:hypothetical protein
MGNHQAFNFFAQNHFKQFIQSFFTVIHPRTQAGNLLDLLGNKSPNTSHLREVLEYVLSSFAVSAMLTNFFFISVGI